MSPGVSYTIAVANYNMADTLRRSLTSVLDQVDDRFEVLVVDDGSTDESPEILDDLSGEYDQLRWIRLEPDPSRHLGKTRNVSVEEAAGDHVILHLDADDEFPDGAIADLVAVYEQIREQRDDAFVLTAAGATVAPRDFLLELGPYRNLPVGGEDLDFWRRTFAEGTHIWIKSDNMAQKLGYEKSATNKMRRWYRIAVADFQTGVTLASYLEYARRIHSWIGVGYYVLMLPVAYAHAQFRASFSCPEEFERKWYLDEYQSREGVTLDELDDTYGVDVDTTALSPVGRELFGVTTDR